MLLDGTDGMLSIPSGRRAMTTCLETACEKVFDYQLVSSCVFCA